MRGVIRRMFKKHSTYSKLVGGETSVVELDFSRERGSLTDKIYNYSLDNIKVVLLNTQSIYNHLGICEYLKKIHALETMGSMITTFKCGTKSVKILVRSMLIKLRIYRLFNY